jgi:hypothetical protein
MVDRLPFVHGEPRLKECEQRHALTIRLGADENRMLRKSGRRNRARGADRASEIVAAEIACDALEGRKIERPVAPDRPSQRGAELLAVKILQLRAV